MFHSDWWEQAPSARVKHLQWGLTLMFVIRSVSQSLSVHPRGVWWGHGQDSVQSGSPTFFSASYLGCYFPSPVSSFFSSWHLSGCERPCDSSNSFFFFFFHWKVFAAPPIVPECYSPTKLECVCVCTATIDFLSHLYTRTLTQRIAVTLRLVEHKSLLAVTYVGWMLTQAKECVALNDHTRIHTHLVFFFFWQALKNAVRVVDSSQLFGIRRRAKETGVEVKHSAADWQVNEGHLWKERSLFGRFAMKGQALFFLFPTASFSFSGGSNPKYPSVWLWLFPKKLHKLSYWNHSISDICSDVYNKK